MMSKIGKWKSFRSKRINAESKLGTVTKRYKKTVNDIKSGL